MRWPFHRNVSNTQLFTPKEVADLYDRYKFVPMTGGYSNIISGRDLPEQIAACASGIISYHINMLKSQNTAPHKELFYETLLQKTVWGNVDIRFYWGVGEGFDQMPLPSIYETQSERDGYRYGKAIRDELEARGWIFSKHTAHRKDVLK